MKQLTVSHRRARLKKQMFIRFLLEYHAIKDLSWAIEAIFHESKILIPVENGSTDIMKATSPWINMFMSVL